MHLPRIGLLIALACLTTQAASAQDSVSRTWSDSSGQFKIEAVLLEQTDDLVKLRKSNGKIINITLGKLSQADRDYLSKRGDPSKPDALKIEALREAALPAFDSMVIVEVTDGSRKRCGLGLVVQNDATSAYVMVQSFSIDYPGETPNPRPYFNRESKYAVLVENPDKPPRRFEAEVSGRMHNGCFVLHVKERLPRKVLELKETPELVDKQPAVVAGYLFETKDGKPAWSRLIEPIAITVPPGKAGSFVLFDEATKFGTYKPQLVLSERGELIAMLRGNSQIHDSQNRSWAGSPEFQLNRPGRYSLDVSRITQFDAHFAPSMNQAHASIGKSQDGKLSLNASFHVLDPFHKLQGEPKAALLLPTKEPSNGGIKPPTAEDWSSPQVLRTTFKRLGRLNSSFGTKMFDWEEQWVAIFPLEKYPSEKQNYYWLRLEFAGKGAPQYVFTVVSAEIHVPQEGLRGGVKVKLHPPGRDPDVFGSGQRREIGPRIAEAKEENLLTGQTTRGAGFELSSIKLFAPAAVLRSSDGKHLICLSQQGVLQKVAVPSMKQTLVLDLSAKGIGLAHSSQGLVALIDESVPNESRPVPSLAVIDEQTFEVKRVFELESGTTIAGAPTLPVVYLLSRNRLTVFDLKSGKPAGQVLRQLKGIAVTGDGKYLLTGDVGLTRYRIDGLDLYEEQSTPGGSDGHQVWLSSDSKYAAFLSQRAPGDVPGAPSIEHGVYVYDVANLAKTPIALETTDSSPVSLDYDPVKQRFFADAFQSLCIAFNKDGKREFEIKADESGFFARNVVLPGGKHLLVFSRQPYLVTLSK